MKKINILILLCTLGGIAKAQTTNGSYKEYWRNGRIKHMVTVNSWDHVSDSLQQATTTVRNWRRNGRIIDDLKITINDVPANPKLYSLSELTQLMRNGMKFEVLPYKNTNQYIAYRTVNSRAAYYDPYFYRTPYYPGVETIGNPYRAERILGGAVAVVLVWLAIIRQ